MIRKQAGGRQATRQFKSVCGVWAVGSGRWVPDDAGLGEATRQCVACGRWAVGGGRWAVGGGRLTMLDWGLSLLLSVSSLSESVSSLSEIVSTLSLTPEIPCSDIV